MDLGIAGRRAIVCASSQGLGLASAEALVAEGVHVVINGQNGRLERFTKKRGRFSRIWGALAPCCPSGRGAPAPRAAATAFFERL